MQAMVPQFIDVEDRITPLLTIKQFFYLIAAGACSAILYPFLQTMPWLVLTALILGLGAAFGFLKINGRPFSVMLYIAAKFFWNPHLYMFQKNITRVEISTPQEPVHAEKKREPERVSSERLEQISRLLDSKGDYK
ncbi:MAG: PrgI family protein [Patescibacteria group bacterium]|nr:PrgI family protein [Patescibacteria group bacterium]